MKRLIVVSSPIHQRRTNKQTNMYTYVYVCTYLNGFASAADRLSWVNHYMDRCCAFGCWIKAGSAQRLERMLVCGVLG